MGFLLSVQAQLLRGEECNEETHAQETGMRRLHERRHEQQKGRDRAKDKGGPSVPSTLGSTSSAITGAQAQALPPAKRRRFLLGLGPSLPGTKSPTRLQEQFSLVPSVVADRQQMEMGSGAQCVEGATMWDLRAHSSVVLAFMWIFRSLGHGLDGLVAFPMMRCEGWAVYHAVVASLEASAASVSKGRGGQHTRRSNHREGGRRSPGEDIEENGVDVGADVGAALEAQRRTLNTLRCSPFLSMLRWDHVCACSERFNELKQSQDDRRRNVAMLWNLASIIAASDGEGLEGAEATAAEGQTWASHAALVERHLAHDARRTWRGLVDVCSSVVDVACHMKGTTDISAGGVRMQHMQYKNS